jgi:hypothetical protein
LEEKRANVTGAYKCRDCGLEVDEVNIHYRLTTQCRDCFLIDKREQKRIRGQLNPLAKWTLEKFDNMKFRTSEWNVIRSKAGNPSLIMGWKNAEELMNSLFPEKSMDNHFTIICAVSRRGLWNSEDNRHDKETLDCVSVERKNNNQFEVATVASYTGSNIALVANLFQMIHRTLHWDQDYFKKIKELYNHRIMVVRHDPNIFVHAIADFKLQGENSRNNIVRWIKAKISDATRHVLTKSKDRTVGKVTITILGCLLSLQKINGECHYINLPMIFEEGHMNSASLERLDPANPDYDDDNVAFVFLCFNITIGQWSREIVQDLFSDSGLEGAHKMLLNLSGRKKKLVTRV